MSKVRVLPAALLLVGLCLSTPMVSRAATVNSITYTPLNGNNFADPANLLKGASLYNLSNAAFSSVGERDVTGARDNAQSFTVSSTEYPLGIDLSGFALNYEIIAGAPVGTLHVELFSLGVGAATSTTPATLPQSPVGGALATTPVSGLSFAQTANGTVTFNLDTPVHLAPGAYAWRFAIPGSGTTGIFKWAGNTSSDTLTSGQRYEGNADAGTQSIGPLTGSSPRDYFFGVKGAVTAAVWDGSTSSDVSEATNWSTDIAPNFTETSNPESRVVFTGNSNTTPTLAGSRGVTEIVFDSNASNFTFDADTGAVGRSPKYFVVGGLSGNSNTVGVIMNNSAATQTFLMQIRQRQGFVNANAGDIRFNGKFDVGRDANSAGRDVTFNAAAGKSIFISDTDGDGFGGLTGAGTWDSPGGKLLKSGEGTLDISIGDISWKGNVEISAGTVHISHNFALGGGAAADDGVTYIKSPTSDATSRVTLAGGITTPEWFSLQGRGSASDTPQLVNVSGDNTIEGDVVVDPGSVFTEYTLQSDADLLTIAGSIRQSDSGGVRNLRLRGEGNGLVSGNIVNGGSQAWGQVIKQDAGTWTLSGAGNDYSGTTLVEYGTLLVNGVYTGGGTYTVGPDGTLGGSGTVTADVLVDGSIAPGNSIDQFDITGNVTINGSYLLETDLAGNSDLLNVIGELTLNAGSLLDLDDSSSLNPALTYVVASFTSLDGAFGDVDSTILLTHAIEYTSSQVVLVPIPEPNTAILCALGVANLMVRRRQR